MMRTVIVSAGFNAHPLQSIRLGFVEGLQALRQAVRDYDDLSACDADELTGVLRPIEQATERDSLRGYEGTASVHYFQALRGVISEGVPQELRYVTRNRRPP